MTGILLLVGGAIALSSFLSDTEHMRESRERSEAFDKWLGIEPPDVEKSTVCWCRNRSAHARGGFGCIGVAA